MKWIVFVFGFVSVIRILKSFDDKEYFRKSALTKIGTAYVVMSFVLLISMNQSLTLYTVLSSSLLLLIGCLPLFTVKAREERLLKVISQKIETLLLFMSLGEGFRQAFQTLIRSEKDPIIQSQLIKMYRAVTFPQQNEGYFRSSRLVVLLGELRKIDMSEFGSQERLANLKNYQKILSDFRRKSGKVKSQIYLQIWILSGIYIALLVFMAFMFDLQKMSKWVFFSLVLVVFGHFIAVKLGRRIKWRL